MSTPLDSRIEEITARIEQRSKPSRDAYLQRMQRTMDQNPPRRRLSCGNMAHAFAACGQHEKQLIADGEMPNLGIVTAYNDMLSAHQPYKDYPDQIKATASRLGATAQVAGGVPAMCDGVTQGQAGMELSLFSRDVIALATCVSLTHNMFDANLFLGICDKIVPGMMMGALEFGHLPTLFVPSGPMPSGITNKEKAAQRQAYAEGKIGDKELLAVESASYHSPGTCTFYGTANSNQVLMELMGVQLPGSSFVQPGTPLRKALTDYAVERAIACSQQCGNYRPLYEVLTEKSLVNAVAALLATGGSTNHAMHLIAMARSAGIVLELEDIDEISDSIPLLARVYPNGQADVNQFEELGGLPFVVHELRNAGLLNEEVVNIAGEGLDQYCCKPHLDGENQLVWHPVTGDTLDTSVLRTADAAFAPTGGLKLLKGNLGKAIIKVSAVEECHRVIEAPAMVFESQDELKAAFEAGEMDKDLVAVVRFQGPGSNGMPELHKMTPFLGVLQDKGFKVALVTDGRMSGASGKVPAAIHLSPEALQGGYIARIRNGDTILVDAETGRLELMVNGEELAEREPANKPEEDINLGRPAFDLFRKMVNQPEGGAVTLNPLSYDR